MGVFRLVSRAVLQRLPKYSRSGDLHEDQEIYMSPRSPGGIGPTSSGMRRNTRTGNLTFTTSDGANGARVTNAPSFYQKNERWKQDLPHGSLKDLVWCVLMQHYDGKRVYKIEPKLAEKIKCPLTFETAELRWLQKHEGYDRIARQVHSKYLEGRIKK